MARAFALFLLLISLLVAAPVEARTYAAIVQDFETGEVLHSRLPDKPLYPASLTKMMTLYMLFDALDRGELKLSSKLVASARAAGMPASRLGLKRGQKISVEEAILALVVKSANDVAVVVAEALGKTESGFARAMTKRAREIGMSRTTFMNASGLPNRNQKSTVRDMATLATRLLRDHGEYYHYFSRDKFTYNGRTYRGHNRLMASYPGMDGLKTGYIRASGFNLAATARRDGRRLITVVFGGRTANSRDREVARLMDLGFERARTVVASRNPLMPPPRKPAFAVASALPTPPLPAPEPVQVASLPVVEAPATPPAVNASTAALPSTSGAIAAPGAPKPSARPATANAGAIAPKPTLRLATGPDKEPARGAYGVQVGAYHDPDRARKAAYAAASRVPQILLQGDVDVSALQGRRGKVFRARLVGFPRDLADKACRLLRQQSQDCLVVRTGPLQVASKL